ncbi:MAG: TIM barrel protein [Nanoarchaeota archaeon]|nr:TIM barrel protein [Nanoarchaeota archaeon]MBU4301026.1 TIM barrel protein [Nanoarchaeota archaeon]MBU4451710.1 TIM barrel protein [Nanoarchaeota archaeon]MCG2723948.1 TIM barrel protein [archaeon]
MGATVKFGTAGVPISATKRDTISGISRVRELGLKALEVEFVRGVHMSNETAKKVGTAAIEHGIDLSVHAPYFINLASEKAQTIAESKQRVLDSLERGEAMGAKIVVVHAGFYGKNAAASIGMIRDACIELAEKIRKESWNIILGLETSGKSSQFGTLDEIIELCRDIKECAPVIDFAHIYARQAGHIDYGKVLDAAKEYKHRRSIADATTYRDVAPHRHSIADTTLCRVFTPHLHCHFSGINYSIVSEGKGNERSHEPIGNPQFASLAREILRRKLDMTIICESPKLEEDALKMKEALKEDAKT